MVSAPFFGFFTDEIERVTGAFFVREVIIFFGEAAFGAGAFAAVRLERCDVVLATGFAAALGAAFAVTCVTATGFRAAARRTGAVG